MVVSRQIISSTGRNFPSRRRSTPNSGGRWSLLMTDTTKWRNNRWEMSLQPRSQRSMWNRLEFGTFFAPEIFRNRKSKIAIIAISPILESSFDRVFFFRSPINRDRKSKLFFLRFRTLRRRPSAIMTRSPSPVHFHRCVYDSFSYQNPSKLKMQHTCPTL